MLVTAIPMWVLSLIPNLKKLAVVSKISNLLLSVGLVIIYIYTCQNLPPLSSVDMIVSPRSLPITLGLILYAFEATPLVFIQNTFFLKFILIASFRYFL